MRVKIDGKEHELEIIDKSKDNSLPFLIGIGLGLIIVVVVAFKFGLVSL